MVQLNALAASSLLFASTLLSHVYADTSSSFRSIPTLPASIDVGVTLTPNINDANAKDAQDVCPGYTANNVKNTTLGLTATLNLAGDACNVYGTDIDTLSLTVEYQANDRLSVNIVPSNVRSSNSTQFIVPSYIVAQPQPDSTSGAQSTSDITFDYGNDPSFWFSVTRKSTGDVLFSTQGNKIVYENQFLEIKSALPNEYNLYGLGEVIHALRLQPGLTRTFWASDSADPVDGNIYGNHPIYIDTRYYSMDSSSPKTPITAGPNVTNPGSSSYTSYSHGVYLRNSHGQEVVLGDTSITWRTIGGSFDFYFYAGPTAKDVIRSYQLSATGLPAFQQYWTLGFHQCRWGYQNWTVLQEVVDNYANAGIPLETIWTDIDYMDQYRDFTNDPVAFPVPAGQAFLSKLQASGRHYVPIVDSAIYVPNPANSSDAYEPFDKGNSSDVFLKNPDGSLYIGAVWPGFTAFPDWFSSNAGQWWSDSLSGWYKNISFSGIWIDMSEGSSFCVGSCGTGQLAKNPVHPPFALPGEPGQVVYTYPEGFSNTNASEASSAVAAASSQAAQATGGPTGPNYTPTVEIGKRNINYPPYVINHDQQGSDLSVHAISPNATHADGTADYEVHNLWGHMILNATYNALLDIFPGKRPFIIGRSTFVGSGKWAGHWGGDNFSLWTYMAFSIPQALSFSIFGIPMFGVDTCGFQGNSDEELCNRWMQLSAFFPFYRNHNDLSSNSQEAYVWSSVAQATRDAMKIRGLLLPYIYTLMYNAHNVGDTVMRALAWEFPSDPSLSEADRQFLLGPAIMVTPVLTPGATSVQGVFPGVGSNETWYDWYSQTAVSATAGQNVTISAPLGHIPVYVRGGYVIPLQQPEMTTDLARQQSYSLLVALSTDGVANGTLYIDDGESVDLSKNKTVSFSVVGGKLTANMLGSFSLNNTLANVTVLGLDAAPSAVYFGKNTISTTSYNSTSKVLSITGLESSTGSGAWSGGSWQLSWNGTAAAATAASAASFVGIGVGNWLYLLGFVLGPLFATLF
jgi:alpha-glucosidase